jgi:transcription antitermination factor NusG
MSKTSKYINDLDPHIKKWFAIYTKYKCEKYVVDNLKKKGIEAYLPLLSVTKRYTRKVKTYNVPLINCYAFAKITKDEYIKVIQTEYVFKFLKQRNDLISIPENEIILLKKIVGEFEEEVSLFEGEFVPGQKVEVISGSLTGLKGQLISQKNKSEFLVELNHMGIILKMSIPTGLLRPVNQLVRA